MAIYLAQDLGVVFVCDHQTICHSDEKKLFIYRRQKEFMMISMTFSMNNVGRSMIIGRYSIIPSIGIGAQMTLGSVQN